MEVELGFDKFTSQLVEVFKFAHKSVEKISIQFKQELKRINYVTPTSFLELLSLFKSTLQFKRKELKNSISRL